MKRTCVLGLCLLFSGAAMAATLPVGVGQTYTSLDSAVTAANTTAGADDIVLYDASYVLTGNPTLVSETLTIRTNGQAVVISKGVGTGGQVFRSTLASGTFRIEGASPAAPITLLQNGADVPNINSGPTTTNPNNLQLLNVVLEKPASGPGSGGSFYNVNNIGTGHVLDHVVFVGGSPASTVAVCLIGNSPILTPVGGVTMMDCDFSQADGLGARISHGGVNLTATNCIIARDAGDAVGINQQFAPTAGTTLTFTNCTFASGSLSLIDAGFGAATYTLTTPTCGLIGTASNTLATNPAGSTITVAGTYTLVSDPLTDTDSDGMSNLWEVVGQLDPASSATPNGATDDPDSDGSNNLAEFTDGTNPRDASSHGSGGGPTVPVAGTVALLLLAGALTLAGRKGLARA